MEKAKGSTRRGEPLRRGDASHIRQTPGRPDEITAYLAWSLVTGERASLPEEIPDERGARGEEDEEGAVRCQLRCVQQYGASGSNAWEAGERRLANNQEVRTRRTETGLRFFECRQYPPSNSGESAIPESRATRATTTPIARI